MAPTPPPGRSVAVIAYDQMSPFELAVACEVFGLDRSEQGVPRWDFAVCRYQRGPIWTRTGFSIHTPHRLDRADDADIVVVPTWAPRDTPPPPAVLRSLRRAADRGAWVLGFCTGAFALAHAGLLDGRRATSHWFYAEEFRALFPAVRLDADVLYVADTNVMTSAGTAAAIDLSLHVLRLIDGPEVANAVARRMVVPPHRDGGQSQFVQRPLPPDDDDHSLADMLAWMAAHLDEELPVQDLARRVHLSPRTFARRFRDATGTTPHHWLTGQRVLHAQRLLEGTDLDIDQIARRCGFGSAATLRHHFATAVGTSPQRYRQQFHRVSLSA